MGSKITLSETEAREAYEDGKVVETRPWKWGTSKDVVFERDGRSYMMTVEAHSQEGLQLYDGLEAVEVRPEERRIMIWAPVP